MNEQISNLQAEQYPGKRRINVFLYSDPSCETIEGRWRGFRQLKELYELSDKKFYLTNDPEAADIILFGDIWEKDWTIKILKNEIINKYPHKCFSISWHWHPFYLSHGIYINNAKSFWSLGRVRTGAYTLRNKNEKNPYIESHRISDRDFKNKKYLFTFIGRNSDKIRKQIFNLTFNRIDILIEDSSEFNLWGESMNGRLDRQKYFHETLLHSKFTLCPRGCGPNSIRLFESMQMGVAPIIISDDWVFPKGPRWNEFSIVVKEKNITNLEQIVQSHENNYKEMGLLARKEFEKYFADNVYFNYLISNCIDILNNQLIPETIYWKYNSLLLKSRINISKIRTKLHFIPG
jgi:hypothetical protein